MEGKDPAHADSGSWSWTYIESHGPWPFITRRVSQRADEVRHVWESRVHRKQLAHTSASLRSLGMRGWIWAPGQLNWWIATLFALGALGFILGSVLCLVPNLPKLVGLSSTGGDAFFFAGSIPFTMAAYLQLFQAANAPESPAPDATKPECRRWFGWRPREIGWLSCALQFPGTVLFNFNTFDAMLPGLNWFQQDLEVWVPNILGSILFLASGHLAFIETCHAHWAWKPSSLSWWVTFVNWLGCVGFMVAAIFAFVPAGGVNPTWTNLSLVFTLQGAVCFLVGALLMLPELGSNFET